MCALDVGEVIVRDDLIVISLDPLHFVAELVDLIAGTCTMSFMYSFTIRGIIILLDMTRLGLIYMIVGILCVVCGRWL